MIGIRLRRRPLAAALLTAALTGALAVGTGTATTASAAPTTAAAWSGTSAHPFSDPVWFPLRDPARVSCTFSNPGCNGYHGYWAMDLLGEKGDPVHAAGAGIFRIGARETGCRTSGSETSGTWAWVDHGGGLVTRYNHLDSIDPDLRDGALVTPATRIGTMGSTGDVAPCTTNYLHFEVRTGGITGPRIDPRTLYACEGTTRRSYPGHWGFRSWNDLPKAQQWTPALTNSCLPAAAATSSAPQRLTAARGDRSVRVTWARPASSPSTIDRYTVVTEIWGPSVGAWHSTSYRTVPAAQLSITFTGLQNGRTYRFRVVAHNAAGHSPWTGWVKGIPATAPLAPRTDRNLAAGSTYVRFGWYGSVPQGAPVTSYEARIQYWDGSRWTPWTSVRVPAAELTYRWDGLRRGTVYQVTARAHSAAGASPWGATRKLTTLR